MTEGLLRCAADLGAMRASSGDDRPLLGETLGAWRRATRAELGWPEAGPVVATGHQPGPWHAGILAKYLLADRLAARLGGVAAHLVVDSDASGFDRLDVPVRDEAGALGLAVLPLGPDLPEVVAQRRPVALLPELPATRRPALPSIGAGLIRLRDALARHRDAGSMAEQMGRCTDEWLAPLVAPMPRAAASALLATRFGAALVAAMRDDSEACAAAYDAAIAATPEAGMRPLERRGDGAIELPLWRLDAAGRRRPLFDVDLREELADAAPLPRALLLTALARLVLCEGFVHGLGGAAYDRATERWIAGWLDVPLAPTATATADLRLPLLDPPAAPAEARREAAAAIAQAHRVWHDPEPEGSARGRGPGPIKRELLEAVALASPGAERLGAWRAMHRQLGMLRSRNAGLVARSSERAAEAQARARAAGIAWRRDYAFLLHDPGSIAALVAAVDAEIADDRGSIAGGR